jgi:hypothetical protein
MAIGGDDLRGRRGIRTGEHKIELEVPQRRRQHLTLNGARAVRADL